MAVIFEAGLNEDPS